MLHEALCREGENTQTTRAMRIGLSQFDLRGVIMIDDEILVFLASAAQ